MDPNVVVENPIKNANIRVEIPVNGGVIIRDFHTIEEAESTLAAESKDAGVDLVNISHFSYLH